jgi:hypothetical protein
MKSRQKSRLRKILLKSSGLKAGAIIMARRVHTFATGPAWRHARAFQKSQAISFAQINLVLFWNSFLKPEDL